MTQARRARGGPRSESTPYCSHSYDHNDFSVIAKPPADSKKEWGDIWKLCVKQRASGTPLIAPFLYFGPPTTTHHTLLPSPILHIRPL